MSGCFQTDGLLIKYAWQPLKAMHRRVVTVLHTCAAISDFVAVHGDFHIRCLKRRCCTGVIAVSQNKTLLRLNRGGLTI